MMVMHTRSQTSRAAIATMDPTVDQQTLLASDRTSQAQLLAENQLLLSLERSIRHTWMVCFEFFS